MSTRSTAFDPAAVRRGLWFAGGGALVLAISVFLRYLGRSGFNVSGWDAWDSVKVVFFLALVALVVVLAQLFLSEVALPASPPMILFACGAVSLVILLMHLVDALSSLGDLAYGFLVALLAAIALTYGAYLELQES